MSKLVNVSIMCMEDLVNDLCDKLCKEHLVATIRYEQADFMLWRFGHLSRTKRYVLSGVCYEDKLSDVEKVINEFDRNFNDGKSAERRCVIVSTSECIYVSDIVKDWLDNHS